MKASKLIVVVTFITFAVMVPAWAQKSKGKKQTPAKTQTETKKETKPKVEPTTEVKDQPAASENEQRVREMVAFLQFVLNTLGSKDTPARDKDVLITESYSKIFRDAKVQIEDDLVEKRDVITNKDVIAYLKDVDFFFKDAKFDIQVESIAESTLPNGDLFYKVTATRNLSGITSDGAPMNTTQPRYIEVNFDPEQQDLKIVSIYTHEFDEKEALLYWWNSLSYEWQSVFRKQFQLTDSVSVSDIKRITGVTELDLSGNTYIQNIDPLNQLFDLRTLNLSGTKITDLSPVRNLTGLIDLDLSYCPVFDLTPLRYSTRLEHLNVRHTAVNDLAVLEKMTLLKEIDLSYTPVYSFEFLTSLVGLQVINLEGTQIAHLIPLKDRKSIRELNLSKTLIQDLSVLSDFSSLENLLIDSTTVSDLQPLSSSHELKVLSANHTYIKSLDPLASLKNLERVYCDQTAIDRVQADRFVAQNPRVLIVYDSKDLQIWWKSVPTEWQRVFSQAAGWKVEERSGDFGPSKEALARVTNLDSLSISGNSYVKDLEPLRKLMKLQIVRLSKTGISDLGALEDHKDIRVLDIRDTPVNDLFILRQFSKLHTLYADRTRIDNIDPLNGLASLTLLQVDGTAVNDQQASEFLQKNGRCLLIYKTNRLTSWWQELTPEWKDAFRKIMNADSTANTTNLHRLVERNDVAVADMFVRDLQPLTEFVRLSALQLSGTGVTTIAPLDNLRNLKRLTISNGPLRNIGFIHELSLLEELDISNTPIEELDPLAGLDNLQRLNCGGTQIKKLDPLKTLDALHSFDCSNTRVSNIEDLERLPLKLLKCYNSKLSKKQVEKFKQKKPECQVVYY